jgi:hypothetical protein
MTAAQPLMVLQALAEARALLYEFDDIASLEDAITPLMVFADDAGISEVVAIGIVRAAFKGVAEL